MITRCRFPGGGEKKGGSDMLSEYYNTFIANLCHMTDVTDEEILDNAVAEVTRVDDDEDDVSDEGYRALEKKGVSLFDKSFIDDPQMAVGYIRLPIPIVNVNYLFGSKPILPKLLKRSREELEKLTYYTAKLVVSSSDTSRFPVGSVVRTYDPETQQALSDAHAETVTGAEAIRFLMKAEGVENTGIIHEVLPVPPLDTREQKFMCKKAGRNIAYTERPLEVPFEKTVTRCNRIQRLMQLGAPEIIIMNEGRILQEYVDAAINNGARRGYVKLDYSGMPWYSLRDEYCRITKDHMAYITNVNMSDLPEGQILALAKKIRNTDTDGFDDIENGTDGSYIDEDGTEKNVFDENGPEHTRKAVEARYREYMTELAELKELVKPAIERFLHEKYPSYSEYFDAAEDKIGEAIDIWADDCDEANGFIRHIGYIISAVSYEFLINGTPFYERPEEDEKTETSEEAKKEEAGA